MKYDLAALDEAVSVEISPQPDDTSCGPTCLHAIYRYFGRDIELEQVIGTIERLWHGGTLGVYLGCHALESGFSVNLYTYNLHLFDPTWFRDPAVLIADKLRGQAAAKPELEQTTEAYLRFLELGGSIRYRDLSSGLIRSYLKSEIPLLTGLSATYLYGSCRENPETSADDDVGGEPAGHFVVLCGYDRRARTVLVADPYEENVIRRDHFYTVSVDRLIGAILLGIVTHDANLLAIRPRRSE